jgi:hypothetical protein
MKQFLKKIAFFLGLLLALWGVLEVFYRFVPNNYTQKDLGVTAHYKDCKVLIMGNSHAFYGLNPQYFSRKGYNLANISQTLFYDELLLNKHIDSLVNLDAIVLPIEYSSLTQLNNHPEMLWRRYFYAAQMHLPDSSIYWYDLKKYSLALVPRFSISVQAVIKYLSGKNVYECTPNGWAQLLGVSPGNSYQSAKRTVQKHEEGAKDYPNLEYVERIIAQCKKRGVKVFLVSLPVTSFYAEEANPQRVAAIAKLCSELSDNKRVFYKSFFNDSSFSSEDFYDADHLNTTGAAKCSKMINNFVEENLY